MTRYVAFLRAINVGGHTVKMERLKKLFQTMGFSNVATFIASGNVIFDSSKTDTRAIETLIETQLQAALRYEVATFVRTMDHLQRIAQRQPFPPAELEARGATLQIGFLREASSAEAAAALEAARTDVDEFVLHDRELYWLRRVGLGDREHPAPPLERILGTPITVRNATTIRRIAAKHGG